MANLFATPWSKSLNSSSYATINHMKLWAKQKGFTIVELLIVIVVIGILAAITIVAYNGIQQRGRDAQRKSDISALTKAIHLYNLDKGDFADAGCGNGTGSGFLSNDYDGAGPIKTVNACLADDKYLPKALVDPSGSLTCSGISCHAYMKANCSGTSYLYANLESLPQATTEANVTCYPTWDTDYGMNYVVRVN